MRYWITRFWIFFIILFFQANSCLAHVLNEGWEFDCASCDAPCFKRYAHHFFIGPEIYHLNRHKAGGSKQKGVVYGGRIGYDHIKRYKFYWGGDLFYGEGTLKGKSGLGSHIKSKFCDFNVEGRVGYTFEQKEGWRFSFTPFIGVGYAIERNAFVHPTPLTIHFRLKYTYFPVGFLAKFSYSPCFDIGLNFKAKFMFEAKDRASHDPEFGSVTMAVNNETHYRVELPLAYRYCENIFFNFVPFYEFRHYGEHPGFPFNFLDTKLNIYGAALRVVYSL